jgi:hypothetical protein
MSRPQASTERYYERMNSDVLGAPNTGGFRHSAWRPQRTSAHTRTICADRLGTPDTVGFRHSPVGDGGTERQAAREQSHRLPTLHL